MAITNKDMVREASALFIRKGTFSWNVVHCPFLAQDLFGCPSIDVLSLRWAQAKFGKSLFCTSELEATFEKPLEMWIEVITLALWQFSERP